MANILFQGAEDSVTQNHTAQVLPFKNLIYLQINESQNDCAIILLDIETAIQFSKQLRKTIAAVKSKTAEDERA